jgi:sugar porter (SP) family MFS transporter
MGTGAARTTLMSVVVAVSLSGLLFGFDTAVISGVTDALRLQYDLSAAALGITVSSALVGTMFGAAAAGVFGDRRGARSGLRWAAALYLISGLGCALAWGWFPLLAFRIMAGIAIGASSVLAPIYLAEIAPAARRGAIVGGFQVSIVIGILLAYVCNAAIDAAMTDPAIAWRWKLGCTALPAAIFQFLMIRVPDSPRWLIVRGRSDEAAAASLSLYGHAPIREESVPAATGSKVSLASLWTQARRPMILAILIGALNQLTGINAILYYLNDIFAAAGFAQVSANLQAIAVGVANLVFTIVGMMLIDRVGRRPLLLVGGAAMAVLLTVATAIMLGILPKYLMVGVLVCFIAAFATSQGAVIWVYMSEIFPARFRAAGQALGAGTVWLFDALVSAVFPVAAAMSPAIPFAFFAVCMVVQCILVFRLFPETKEASLEEIERRMHGARPGLVA